MAERGRKMAREGKKWAGVSTICSDLGKTFSDGAGGNRGEGETATQVAPSHNIRSNYCPSRESPPHTVHKSLRRRNGIIVSVM